MTVGQEELTAKNTFESSISIIDELSLLAAGETYFLHNSAIDSDNKIKKTVEISFVTPGLVVPYILASMISVRQEPGVATVSVPYWRQGVNNGTYWCMACRRYYG